jgi:transposase
MSKIPPELEAEMTPAVKAAFLALLERVEQLTKQVESLTDQVEKLTPRNSSLPPSTEHPHAKPKRKPKPGKKRKKGGQKGHKRHSRQLVPSDQCATVTPCYPQACRRCGGELQTDERQPKRHQVWDLPEIEPLINEYQLFRGHCACCGITSQAELPAGVPSGQCGPRLAAFTGLLMGHFRQSKRRASMFLGDLLNIPCSPAWTVKIQNLVSDAIAAPHEQLRQELEKQRQLFVDESPTKEAQQKAWLWVAVAPLFAVFGIFGNRSRESLKALVGDDSGVILNCDRATMYLQRYISTASEFNGVGLTSSGTFRS